jgi:peptidoglycan/xylan/chitin deacetylase (PgdA/CDA1 family)
VVEDPQDWRATTRREQIEHVAGAAGDGDVVLLHDWVENPDTPLCLDRSPTVEALPTVVAAVRERGLSLVRLTPSAERSMQCVDPCLSSSIAG